MECKTCYARPLSNLPKVKRFNCSMCGQETLSEVGNGDICESCSVKYSLCQSCGVIIMKDVK